MKIKTFTFLIIFIGLLGQMSKAQELYSLKELQQKKKYKSLKQARKNPKEVYVLLLDEQNLSTFPEEILTFEHLQYLSLAGNPIKEIPAQLSKLKELQYLDLLFTDLKSLPDAVLEMPNLQKISLAFTPLSNEEEKTENILAKFPDATVKQPPNVYDSYKQMGIVGGLVFNPQQVFGELGVYWGKLDFLLLRAVSAGVEWNPRATAYKAALIWNGLLSVQVNALLLDNHKEQTFALRPELGFGIANISLTYGYNFFVPDDFEDIAKHLVTLRFAFPLRDSKRLFRKNQMRW